MNTSTQNKPIYIFRLTPKISVIWSCNGSLLLILAFSSASWFYGAIHGQSSLSFSLEASQDNLWRNILSLLGFFAIIFGTIVIHELVHGIAFAAFGGSPRYGFKVKFFLPLAYATSPGDYFRRNSFIIIGLAPLIVIDVVCLLLLAIFPQAPWLIWVITFNTAGAIGDIWTAVLLLRCPKSVQVEDREEGMAIYAPPNVTRRQLPFSRTNNQSSSIVQSSLNIILMTLALIILASFLLVPILKTLNIPSFIIGTNSFLILRWENTSKGFGIGFNWLSILILTLVFVLLGIIISKLLQKKN
jgi:Putative zincin peptidase